MPQQNNKLQRAKNTKNDEFYTPLEAIEKELGFYGDYFKDKIVLCNCNDAVYGDFKKYFMIHFKELGLKLLITTAYGNEDENGYAEIYDGTHVITQCFNGKGDFRNDYMINLLKIADVVVTNPPFSLFIPFFNQLIEYNKDFIVLGLNMVITYKDIFPHIKNGDVRLGATVDKGDGIFFIPNNKENSQHISAYWYTNVKHNGKPLKLNLTKRYNEIDYPKYDNFDAINVDRSKDIPIDYDGLIGVPISYYKYLDRDIFEIMGVSKTAVGFPNKLLINGKEKFVRLFIRRKKNDNL